MSRYEGINAGIDREPMLPRVLEPEVMDSEAEARDYDAMDHSAVNRAFVSDLLAVWEPSPSAPRRSAEAVGNRDDVSAAPYRVLDVGAGTARIPRELCRRRGGIHVTAIDLAEHMLQVGRDHVTKAGLGDRISLEKVDAKALPYAEEAFDVVMSNSIVHHIPEPEDAIGEMVRVAKRGGLLFVRDLLRPRDEATVQPLVHTYAAGANAHQKALFEQSLRAALTLVEIRQLVSKFGFAQDTVQQTSDRHWTWTCRRGAPH